MTTVVLLFAVGIVLIVLEVIIPGAILGTIGALLMLAGCVIAFTTFGTLGGIAAVTAAFAVGGLALYIEFRVLPKTRIGKKAFLTKEVTAVAAAVGEEARGLVGQPAEAVTMLSPSGYVLVAGKRYEAFCRTGQVPAGSALEVTGADNFRLIVSPIRT